MEVEGEVELYLYPDKRTLFGRSNYNPVFSYSTPEVKHDAGLDKEENEEDKIR